MVFLSASTNQIGPILAASLPDLFCVYSRQSDPNFLTEVVIGYIVTTDENHANIYQQKNKEKVVGEGDFVQVVTYVCVKGTLQEKKKNWAN